MAFGFIIFYVGIYSVSNSSISKSLSLTKTIYLLVDSIICVITVFTRGRDMISSILMKNIPSSVSTAFNLFLDVLFQSIATSKIGFEKKGNFA